jgi:uncharacterized membrane protein
MLDALIKKKLKAKMAMSNYISLVISIVCWMLLGLWMLSAQTMAISLTSTSNKTLTDKEISDRAIQLVDDKTVNYLQNFSSLVAYKANHILHRPLELLVPFTHV